MSVMRVFSLVVQGVAMVLLAAVLAFFFMIFGIPGLVASAAQLEDREYTLRVQLYDLKRADDFTRKFAADPEHYARYTKAIEEQRDVERQIIPDDPALDSFQTTVKKDAAVAGVQLREFIRLAPVPGDYYTEEPFQAHIEGRYDQVKAFFKLLGQEERQNTVSKLTVVSPFPDNTPNHRLRPNEPVDANCVVSTYYRRAPGAAPLRPVRK
jgi:Tfp pilus assembly protein PilO